MFGYFKGFDRINFLNPPKLSSSRTRGLIFKLEKESIAIIQEEIFFLVGLQMNGIHCLIMLLILIL